MQEGKVVSINISEKKGGKKRPVKEAVLTSTGIRGDGHSGRWHRQVSLLSAESIEEVNRKGVGAEPGDFAENITTSGLRLDELKVGDIIKIGSGAALKVTQIGKECLQPCRIYYQMGSCIMPREGIFCRVINPGNIRVGNKIKLA
ncbi:MAG: MOSC domain-containing protein [Actinomycetota bacterium]